MMSDKKSDTTHNVSVKLSASLPVFLPLLRVKVNVISSNNVLAIGARHSWHGTPGTSHSTQVVRCQGRELIRRLCRY